jgi:5-methylcytosine-specific restriction endonuclease McrA
MNWENYGIGANNTTWHIDHIIPISKWWLNTIDNIQPLCFSCNSSKRANTIDYRKK